MIAKALSLVIGVLQAKGWRGVVQSLVFENPV